MPVDENGLINKGGRDREDARALVIPILQTLVFLSCLASVVVLGVRNVIDPPAITAIVGAIVGSVGVLAGVGMATARNGRRESR